MTVPKKEDGVGYARPPKETRWKKGQSGNPRKQYRRRPASALETIDELLLSPIDVVEKGAARKATVLEAIILQLWQKELAGNQRALRARLKFEEIVRETSDRGIEIEFYDSDYTRAMAAGRPFGGKNHE